MRLRKVSGTGIRRLLFQCSLNIHSPSQAGQARPERAGMGEPGLGGEQEGPDSSQQKGINPTTNWFRVLLLTLISYLSCLHLHTRKDANLHICK